MAYDQYGNPVPQRANPFAVFAMVAVILSASVYVGYSALSYFGLISISPLDDAATAPHPTAVIAPGAGQNPLADRPLNRPQSPQAPASTFNGGGSGNVSAQPASNPPAAAPAEQPPAAVPPAEQPAEQPPALAPDWRNQQPPAVPEGVDQIGDPVQAPPMDPPPSQDAAAPPPVDHAPPAGDTGQVYTDPADAWRNTSEAPPTVPYQDQPAPQQPNQPMSGRQEAGGNVPDPPGR